jgi:hypothetical protein
MEQGEAPSHRGKKNIEKEDNEQQEEGQGEERESA